MLPDWYFCCCIQAEPDPTAIFLSTLDGLEDVEHDPELARLALGELGRMDVWMQGYALPSVLRLLGRQGLSAYDLRDSVRGYLAGLQEALPEDFADPFIDLAEAVTSASGPDGILGALRQCARSLRNLPLRHPSTLPYLDLKEFLPETVLLAVIADQLARDGAFATLFGESDDPEVAVLGPMLQAALRHELGRFAFRLALRVAPQVGSGYTAERLSAFLWSNPLTRPELEPDLLASWAELLFFDRPGGGGQPGLATALIEESITLHHLRRQLAEARSRPQVSQMPPNAVLPALTDEVTRVLTSVLWQAVLWHLSAGVDAAVTADLLAFLWHPPTDVPGGDVTLQGPSAPEARKQWWQELFQLLRLRNLPRLHLYLPAAPRLAPGDTAWVLFSPWLNLNTDKRALKRLDDRIPRYPAWLNIAVEVRLMAAATLAGRLLLTLPPESPERMSFAALLVHAYDVLALFQLPPGGPGADRILDQHPRLSPPILALAIYTQRRIQRLGSCQDERLAPDIFLAPLRRVEAAEAAGRPPALSYDESTFLRSILPAVLLSWVADAYPSATRGSGSARWLALIPELYDRQGAQDLWHQLQGELIARFLAPGTPRRSERFDWRYAKTKAGLLGWSIGHRQLLLTLPLCADEWLRPEWNEPVDRPATVLARALERLAALKEPGELSDEIAARWRREWADLLSGINSSRALDRFLRLRLLELLADPVLEHDPTGRELIALTLLEFGSLYELERLFDLVYPASEEAWAAPPPQTVQDLRLALLHALSREVDRSAAGSASRLNPQEPLFTRSAFERERLIRKVLLRIAFFSRLGGAAPYRRRLADSLAREHERSLARQTSILRRIETEVELRGWRKLLLLPAEEGEPGEWRIRSVAYDPNFLTGQLLVEDWADGDCVDLFTLPPYEVHAFLDRRSAAYVLASVVNVYRDRDREQFVATMHCGLRQYLRTTWSQRRYEPGQWVRLPVTWRGYRLEVDSQKEILRLRPRRRPERPELLRLREYRRDGVYALELASRGEVQPPSVGPRQGAGWDLEIWQADFAQLFRAPVPGEPRPAERETYARLDEAGQWRPLDQGLIHLLLAPAGFGAEGVAVLAYLDAAASSAWRFSLRPGEVYLLAASDFATADAEELEAELAQHPDASGLLVAVRAELCGERVELRLAHGPVRDPEFLALYPEFCAPFDRRNLLWRDLFRGSGTEIAKRVDGRWSVTVEAPPSGFPAEVRVQWMGQRPPDDQDEAEIVVAWDPWKGILSGETVQTHRLTLQAGETPAEFVPRWLALKRGDRLPIVRALGRVSEEGDVLCRTAEGLLVSVEAESLSMRLLPPQGPPELREARLTEITRCWGRAYPAVLDPGQLPPQVLDLGGAEGVLAQVPRRTETAGTQCEIWWHSGSEVLRHRVLIENLAQLLHAAKTLAVGARIRAERRNGGWSFEIQPHQIKARALWTLAEWRRPARGLAYLGTVTIEGGTGAIAEQEPGRLLVLPAVPGGVRHLAEGDGQVFLGGLGPERRTYNASRGRTWTIGQSEYRRATLPFRDGVLCGTCRAEAPQQNVALSQVWMVLEPRGDGAFFLRRSFRLTADAWASRPPRSPDDAAIWRQKLQDYLAAPRDLDATLDLERGEARLADLRVPGALPGDRWTSVVPLAASEGPLVATAKYGKDAKVRLFEDAAGRILASCRLVPALTIDGYRSELRNPDFGLSQTLAARLYYAGMERPAGAGGETYHRFEWGYGRMLLAPESRLRFNGEPFEAARELLYLEDAITNLTFLRPEGDSAGVAPRVDEEPPDEEDTQPALPADEGSILSLDGLSLALSEATSLFRQRSRYRVVHLLHLKEQPDGTLGISSVIGMAEASMEAIWAFRVDRATLDPASERALRRRWPAPSLEEEESEEPAARVVLARLDTEAFRASLGLDVVFRHARMSFLSGAEGDGAPLEQSDLVFVRAGRIGPRRNDMGLQLLPWKELAAVDVGEDCAELLLLRRPFSVREDLLPRIYEGQGAAALEGSALLVNLSGGRGGKVAAALWWSRERSGGRRASRSTGSIPSRSVGALQKAAVEGVVLATVMETAAAGLQVEIRPGVFMTVPADRIESRPQDLRPGAIVRIENASERRFRISRATQGEEWYLTAGLRPAVALPMNPLLDAEKVKAWDPRSSIAWRGSSYPNECFSLGGLPNIVAVPGRFDEQQGVWEDPVARDFIALMQTQHPKVALVGRDGSGTSRLQPAFDSVLWGSLALDRERHEVRFRPFSQSSSAGAARLLSWEMLSFADEPISRIAARVEREKWHYHDTVTGSWSPNGGVRPQKLGDHSGLDGPLFFEAAGENLRLRYAETSLPRFGFPPRELVHSLERLREGRASYTVAGVLPEGGLWLELAPGRVANLPAPLVVTDVEGHEQSLSHLHWSAFAPGDQVTLQLASSDPMSVDRIALVEWLPGPRRALGRRCFLPVAGVDAKRGVTHLGAGELQLDLPVLWGEDPPPEIILLSSDNRVFAAGSSRLPERGDTVLLGLDPEGLPVVLGFPEFRPLAEGRQLESWDRDPLAGDLCALDLPPRARAEQLAGVIAAAGNALPVTVELAHAKDKLLFFSRRAQRAGSYVPEGRVSQGRVLGLLRDGETALVRCGSGLLKAPVREIVSGLPGELCAEAVKTLLGSGTMLWIRNAGEGTPLQFRLSEEAGRTLHVEPIAVLSDETRKGSPRGVVCRGRASRALYWLPAKEAAWATLSAAELALVFKAGETLKVRLRSSPEAEQISPSLSLIDLAEVRKELVGLGVGKEMTVRVLARRPSEPDRPARYLVRTLSSRVVLECETYDDESLEPGQDIPVEVVRRRRGLGVHPFVITVPVGRKRYSLDLPSWMLDEHRERGTLRPAFREYLQWCEEAPILPDLATLRIENLDDAELQRCLCLAWKLSPETGENPLGVVRFQIGLGREWIRRHQSRPEIDLPYALISLLLLQRNADRGADRLLEIRPDLPKDDAWIFIREWHQQAFELVQNLGQRALRSAHVEVIWQDWLRPVEGELPAGDLRRRLRLLEEALRPSVGLEVLRAIRQFCHAVELRETLYAHDQLLPLADALRRATGELERTDSLMRAAEITRGLVELYRALPTSRSQETPGLLPHHVGRLKKMLEKINAQAIDITLLDPLTGDRIRSIDETGPEV